MRKCAKSSRKMTNLKGPRQQEALLQRHCSYPLPIYFAQPSSKEGNLHSPAPPVHIIQTIQHPHGISPTKLKITKNILTTPAKIINDMSTARCACGNIIPSHGQDRDSWRSSDTSRRRFKRGFDIRFGRRFSRRFHSRSWDWERGRSHFRGGWME